MSQSLDHDEACEIYAMVCAKAEKQFPLVTVHCSREVINVAPIGVITTATVAVTTIVGAVLRLVNTAITVVGTAINAAVAAINAVVAVRANDPTPSSLPLSDHRLRPRAVNHDDEACSSPADTLLPQRSPRDAAGARRIPGTSLSRPPIPCSLHVSSLPPWPSPPITQSGLQQTHFVARWSAIIQVRQCLWARGSPAPDSATRPLSPPKSTNSSAPRLSTARVAAASLPQPTSNGRYLVEYLPFSLVTRAMLQRARRRGPSMQLNLRYTYRDVIL
ncbi:hypothetical protein DFH09DRAFT_1108768 [Mycena vulgaris]|nr:hypothetical protein DFH09DRAFT_1108768 [Mycena vulgaris]